MAGNVNFGITNGPENAPGTEACVSEFVDWAAKKKGMAGSLADQLSPPGAPTS
jgi:hypothetical protein